jgi:hypothetical protein
MTRSNSNKNNQTPTQPRQGSDAVDLEMLQNDNNKLIHRITQMQEGRWRLEERVKDLETLTASLNEKLAQKSNIIRDYAMTVKSGGRRDMKRELHRQDSSLAPTPQILNKIEEVLEDTLMKNIQLKNDLETLGNENEELKLKNADLKKIADRR